MVPTVERGERVVVFARWQSRRKPFDHVDFGALHLVEELARVGGERFHVAPLAFSIDVSNASEDLPEPERPVMTVREFRGISTLIFLRLCWRAPRITSLVRPMRRP